MRASFCPYCATKLILKPIGDEGNVPFCLNCSRPIFDISTPCVIVAVFNEKNEVALIRQSYGKKNLRLISGYVKLKDSLEETVFKEVKEEIGQDVIKLSYIKSFYQERNENLMAGFIAYVVAKDIVLSSEVTECKFYHLDEAISLLTEAKIAKSLLEEIKKVI